MIEDSPRLTLQRSFTRLSAPALSPLQNTPTGFIVDCLEGRGALDYRVKSLLPLKASIVGTAVTCACGPGDNLGLFGALDLAQAGDVVVASTEAFMGCAVIGDLVLEMMKNKGIVAFVTDGLARDLDGIERVGLPIFCKGITPNSPSRNGPATAGFPVSLDGCHVRSGDVVVADRDGVVVVPAEGVEEVGARLVSVKAAESELLQRVQSGLVMPPFYQDLLDQGAVVTKQDS